MKALSLFRENIYIIFILTIGAFLRFDRLPQLMAFIGDQGWFYLSARDMLLSGNIPLVGITSSHTWLHQGPLWTYMLAGALFISNFNPVAGSILTSSIGVASIFLIYKLGADFFSKKFGLIAALIYATSPLIVIHERLAYHTSPIPFVVLLLIYSMIKVLKGKSMYFLIVSFCLSLLYNFELATVVFILVVLLFVGVGFYWKEKWFKKIMTRKILVLSALGLLTPMIPILIYDFQHGFPQTIKYAGWFVYKFLSLIGLISVDTKSDRIINVISFFFERYKLLIGSQETIYENVRAILFFILSIYFIGRASFAKINSGEGVIFLSTIIPFVGLILSQTRSEAYLPMLFPGLVLSLSYVFMKIVEKNIRFQNLAYITIIVVCTLSAEFIYSHNYLIEKKGGFGLSIEKRKQAVQKILDSARGEPYNLSLQGPGSEFASSTMNYEYLAWWLDRNPPSKEKQDLVFTIEEKQSGIDVKIK